MRLPRPSLRRALTIACALPVLALSGCLNFIGLDDDRDQEERLERNWREWRSLDIDDYEIVVQRGCFCDENIMRPVRVLVRNDAIVSLTFDDTGAPVPAAYWGLFHSIDGLFGIVDDAIDKDAHDLEVRYDGSYNFPRLIEIDYSRNAVDEEVTFTAYGFRAH